jgi:hypothetical protein
MVFSYSMSFSSIIGIKKNKGTKENDTIFDPLEPKSIYFRLQKEGIIKISEHNITKRRPSNTLSKFSSSF